MSHNTKLCNKMDRQPSVLCSCFMFFGMRTVGHLYKKKCERFLRTYPERHFGAKELAGLGIAYTILCWVYQNQEPLIFHFGNYLSSIAKRNGAIKQSSILFIGTFSRPLTPSFLPVEISFQIEACSGQGRLEQFLLKCSKAHTSH